MPFHPLPELQGEIDAVPIDFAANLAELPPRGRTFSAIIRRFTSSATSGRFR